MPIIMLTGSDEEADVVRGLDAGANDYIAKPFRLNELLARLRAQLRIFENSEDAVFTIGPYTFRPSAKLLQEPARNRRIRLTEKEAAILKFLYRAGTKPVARQVLLNEVWGYNAARHHAHAGDPYLPAAPEDRAGSGQRPPAGHRGRRLPAGPQWVSLPEQERNAASAPMVRAPTIRPGTIQAITARARTARA